MKKLALITLVCLLSIAALLLTWQLSNVVGVMVVAILLATMMSGFVQVLVRRDFSQRTARLMVIAGTLVTLGILGVITVYVIGARLPLALADFRSMYSDFRAMLLDGNSAQQAMAGRLPPSVMLDDLLLGADGSGLLTIASGISSNFGVLISNVVLVIFVALYWVADRERIERLWLSLLSPAQRIEARNLVYQIEDEVGAHLRSQAIQFLAVLFLTIIGYQLMGMQYPFLLAWAVTIAWIIPLVGSFFAVLIAVALGLIDGYAIAALVVIYTIAVFVIVPLIARRFHSLRERQGSIVGLMIAIALLDVMGVVGVFVAIPLTVVVQVLNRYFLSPTLQSTENRPQQQMQAPMQLLSDKLISIQERIDENSSQLSPSTLSMYDRLKQLVLAVENK